jgi:nicotinate phosphoribosyltransferase
METLISEIIPRRQLNQNELNQVSDPLGLLSGIDYYKFTMGQFFFDHEPYVEATFTFQNRGTERLADYLSPAELQDHFDAERDRGFNPIELSYLGTLSMRDGQSVLSDAYLHYLKHMTLPSVEVGYDTTKQDITIQATGNWPIVTYWETKVMRDISALYTTRYLQKNDLSLAYVCNEGDARLSQKIEQLNADPTLKIMEFGTRRAAFPAWHKHVFERLITEAPATIIGTSNVGFSALTAAPPQGTVAHEADMGVTALADARGGNMRAAHGQFLDDWYNYWGQDYSIALTDTFGSDFFFSDFGSERAVAWNGVRQDSGNPEEFANKYIRFLGQNGIDPTTKSLIFSDGLTISAAQSLHAQFGNMIKDTYGIGTNLTADTPLPPRNFVMKATRFHDLRTDQIADAVKLSDNPGKHTGSAEKIGLYQQIFKASGGRYDYGVVRNNSAAV